MLRRLLLTLALILALPAAAQGASATPSKEMLGWRETARRVTIVRDDWGIAHIRATNEDDLFFAQGYNAARDRMFQLEMWRRLATGTTAAEWPSVLPQLRAYDGPLY